MADPVEYDGITEATNHIVTKQNYRGPGEILPISPTEEKIDQWTQTLSGFEAGTNISPEANHRLQEVDALYKRAKPDLERAATELQVKSLNEFTPSAVLFMVCIRDLQNDYVGKSNLNPHKFGVLRGGRYSVKNE